jgi:hypothetical protein
MHDKREVLFEKLRGTELENLEKKQKLLLQLPFYKSKCSFNGTAQIEKVEALNCFSLPEKYLQR